jgi:SAM-dependent methyltransferase
MNISKTTHDTYNRIAKDWHRDHQKDTWWQEGTDDFIAVLPQGGLVLDVGCGGGFKSRYLVRNGLAVVGIDFSEELVKIASGEVPEAEFRVMDMRDIGTLSERFDGVFAQASLLHMPRSQAPGIVRSFADVLKPGGCLYIAVKEAYPDGPLEEVKTENDYGYPYKRFFSYYTPDDLREYMHEAGFGGVAERREKSGSTTWLQIIGRKRQ